MLTDIFYIVLAAFLQIPLLLLKAITWVIPSQIPGAVTYFLTFLLYWRGYWDVETLLNVDIAFLTFLGVYYTLMLILSAWASVPVVGRRFKKPTISTKPGK